MNNCMRIFCQIMLFQFRLQRINWKCEKFYDFTQFYLVLLRLFLFSWVNQYLFLFYLTDLLPSVKYNRKTDASWTKWGTRWTIRFGKMNILLSTYRKLLCKYHNFTHFRRLMIQLEEKNKYRKNLKLHCYNL